MGRKKFNQYLKSSFIKITFNGKTLLALLFFVVILFAIWRYHLQIEWYNEAHGVISSIEPREKGITYMTYLSLFTFIVYISFIIGRTFKQMK
jgi:hypothetical protein